MIGIENRLLVARRKVGVIIKEHEEFCDDGTVL